MLGVEIAFRAAVDADRPFVEAVFFETQRWVIETLFGWRGEAVERAKFAASYDAEHTSIVVVDGDDAGWVTVQRDIQIRVDAIYLTGTMQGRGIGSTILRRVIADADAAGVAVRLSTAKINPARRLYTRLGFVDAYEDDTNVYLVREPAG
jgi:GNAT superfamily N-acetyltransferase